MKDYSLEHIDNLFKDYKIENLSKENCLLEISAMRNTQPPEQPTFFLNQQDAKDRIKFKLREALSRDTFSCIVLKGVVGDGKTHFLNHIYSHVKKCQPHFFIVKLRVEETERFKRNFIKSVVAELFARYYYDFKLTFQRIASQLYLKNGNNDDELSRIVKEINISVDLAKVLACIVTDSDNESAAMRILGNSYGKTELKKLKINDLTSADYVQILRLFSENCGDDKLLIIILDEFEHAYGLSKMAKTVFFQSFKQFYDEAAPNYKRTSFIAAFTEQYAKGNKKEENIETAMWTRLEPSIIELESFKPTHENLEMLSRHIAIRYQKAYDIELVSEKVLKDLSRMLLKKLGTTHAINYRKAVSSLINMLDDIREQKKSLNNRIVESQQKDSLEQLDLFSWNYENTSENETNESTIEDNFNNLEVNYKDLVSNARIDWESTDTKLKKSKLKSALEEYLKAQKFRLSKVTEYPDDISRIEALKSGELPFIFCISTSKSGKSLVAKFDDCLKMKDSLLVNAYATNVKVCFVYFFESRNNSLINSMNLHPEIIDISIEESSLFDLLALRLVNGQELLKEILIDKLESTFNQILSIEGNDNE